MGEETKAERLFKLMDKDGDGFVTKSVILNNIHIKYQYFPLSLSLWDYIWGGDDLYYCRLQTMCCNCLWPLHFAYYKFQWQAYSSSRNTFNVFWPRFKLISFPHTTNGRYIAVLYSRLFI